MACSGNANEPCGGPNRFNLFDSGKTPTTPAGPVTNPGPAGWQSLGCYMYVALLFSPPLSLGRIIAPGSAKATHVFILVDGNQSYCWHTEIGVGPTVTVLGETELLLSRGAC